MGLGTNIVVFTFILSWIFWLLLGFSPLMVNMVGCFQNPDNPIIAGATCPIGGLPTASFYTVILALFAIGTLAVAGSILSGSSFFPDPYKLFGGVAIFLFGLATFPADLFLSNHPSMPIPNEIKVLLAGMFMLCYTIAFLMFFRVGGGSTW